jgi:hypothetical protein
VEARSFDLPRERPAPRQLRGHTLAGEERAIEVTALTLVVAIKPNCDGCKEFVQGSLRDLDGVDVVLVSATSGNEEWAAASREILVSAELLGELGIRSAPFYVLIDPATLTVVAEGTLFSPAQVASEIASFIPL